MTKYKLLVEQEVDYDLVGFSSHQSDYRVCWSLNEHFKWQLSKSDEPYIVSTKAGKIISEHSMYEWFDEDFQVDYYLIKNKSYQHHLLPEISKIDYLLIIREANIVNVDDLLTSLKEINHILAAYIFDPNEFSSSKKLIF